MFAGVNDIHDLRIKIRVHILSVFCKLCISLKRLKRWRQSYKQMLILLLFTYLIRQKQ